MIGINTSKTTNSSISIAVNSAVLKEIQDKFNVLDNIESITFEELKEKYYYEKINTENIKNSIPKYKWRKYSKIGNIENTIRMELVKASYKDGIVSLRYKNNISDYISSMQLAASFKEQLVKDIEIFMINRIKEFNLKRQGAITLYGYINGVFYNLVMDRIIEHQNNPCLYVDKKKFNKYYNKEVRPISERTYSPQNVIDLLNTINQNLHENELFLSPYGVKLALLTGMRSGEICGLK